MIIGLDGPAVVLAPRAAALLARPLERLVADACRRGETVEPCVLAALADCERVRRLLVAQHTAGSANGTSEPAVEDVSVERGHDLSTAATADILGVSSSYLRRLARDRRLGSKLGGTWMFNPAEVALLAHNRRT